MNHDNVDTSEYRAPRRDRAAQDARRAILDDLRPVQPLPPAWKRALLWVVPWATVTAAVVWLVSGLSPDFAAQSPVAVFGVSAGSIIAATALAWLLAREIVPGRRAPLELALVVLITVVTARFVTAEVIDAWRPFPMEDGQGIRLAFVCASAISAVALPGLVALFALVRTGLVTRTLLPAALAGAATALAGEACWQLHCPFTSPTHIVAGHLSPILVLVALWPLLMIAARWIERRRGQAARGTDRAV